MSEFVEFISGKVRNCWRNKAALSVYATHGDNGTIDITFRLVYYGTSNGPLLVVVNDIKSWPILIIDMKDTGRSKYYLHNGRQHRSK